MTTETIILRHRISKVASVYPAALARDLLADPHYGELLYEVDSEKPEVLSQPYDAEGGKPLSDEHVAQVEGNADAPVEDTSVVKARRSTKDKD